MADQDLSLGKSMVSGAELRLADLLDVHQVCADLERRLAVNKALIWASQLPETLAEARAVYPLGESPARRFEIAVWGGEDYAMRRQLVRLEADCI